MTERLGSVDGDEARRRLHELAARDAPLAERTEAMLQLGVDYLDVENGHVAEIDVESGSWEAVASTDPPDGAIPTGFSLELASTYCRHAIEQDHPYAVHDVDVAGLADDPAHERTALSCYHGGAITVDGDLYGTVCFVSADPRAEPFSDEETLFVDLAATLLGHAIQRERHLRHVAEQRSALARRERQLESLVDASFDLVLRVDTSGTIRAVPQCDCELLGYEPGELIGTNYAELMATQEAFERASAGLRRVLQGRSSEGFGHEVLTADDRTVTVDVRAAPILAVDEEAFDRDAALGASPSSILGESLEDDADAGDDVPEPADSGDVPEPGDGDDVAGATVVLRDATRRKRYEHLVSVLQRVLRHNVRNALNVVHGAAEEVTPAEERDSRELERIRETATDLLALTEKAGSLEAAVGDTDDPHPADLGEIARRVAGHVGERYPDATLDVQVDGEPTARVTESLQRAVEEVVENAVKHGAAEPNVAVSVAEVEDVVELAVADDGPGMPDVEREVLTAGRETPLTHGEGLGHWFVYWIVASLNGEVSAESDDDGTTVRIRVPAARYDAVDESPDSA